MTQTMNVLLDTANRDTLTDAPAHATSELLLLGRFGALCGLLVGRARTLLYSRVRHEPASLRGLIHLAHNPHPLPIIRHRNYTGVTSAKAYLAGLSLVRETANPAVIAPVEDAAQVVSS